jgi:non-ribosomal peptide synthetase component F
MEMFVCWKSGGALYAPPSTTVLVPLNFAVTHELTIWSSVPTLANFLLKLGLLKDRVLPHVRLTIFGGDALSAELAHAWAAAAPHSRILNLYGPTEVTITSTQYEFEPKSAAHSGLVPIGIPFPGLRHVIVDDGCAIETEDTLGELWLAGDQLAVGYWQNSEATRAAFVRYPSDAPAADLWYRTGDLVSWRNGAGLSFRGRLDRQVKLRGCRVELLEVESALRKLLESTLVAVVPVRDANGICQQIVAYCEKLTFDEAILRGRCLEQLPRYMVPHRIFELDPFPLTDHGKVDYLALAARTAPPQ